MELWIAATFVLLLGSCPQGKATVEHSKLHVASYVATSANTLHCILGGCLLDML